ncbi:MAG: Omp28-related outer membrane protein, partial [Bacteroidales bacterium]|nr:Omp28-related outer membrane protein [Bacteroidales bacterium]
HASGDPMFNQGLYNSFENVRTNGGGIPSFWIGDTKTNNESFMTTLLEQEQVAGIAISSSKSGTSITVKTKTEFFEAGEGEYYLSVLILESGIDGSSSSGQYAQNGTDTPATYKHDFVLRASATDGNAYGELVTTDPAKGTTVSKNYTITLEESWNNEVYAVAVLWRKSTTGMPVFEFVNAVK